MTTANPTVGFSRPSLTSQTVPSWVFGLIGAVSIVVTLGLFAGTPLKGAVGFVVLAGLIYLVAASVVSFAVEGGRSARNRLATNLIWTTFLIALVPLIAVLEYTIKEGSHVFGPAFLTHSTFNIANNDPGGGAYHAIIGTVEQVAIASIIAVPLGVLVATYLVEYGRNGALSKAISFFIDVLTGLPSIVAGLFIYALWILALHQSFSGFAGSLALFILMLPLVTRTSEEMLRLVPDQLREASYALGVPKWKTVLKIVYPTALPGMVTGTLLAVARAVGETAPVLLLVFVNQKINTNPFSGAQESLSVFVFQNAALPNDTAVDRAWAAALTLILIVLLLNLIARLATRRNRIARG
jgi:phosphate transport system permease protein